MNPHRREWLGTVSGAVCGLALAGNADAIEPIKRSGKPSIRLSLAAYSFRQALDLKKKEMTLLDFIDLAATYPLDAVELTAYYFAETSPEYLAALKGRSTKLGLDISGTAVGNNFCTPNAAELKKQIDSVKTWVEHTSRLGGKTMRIFAGSVAKGDDEEKARARAVEAMQECCEHAGKFGIYLALENHGGITATPDQILGLVKAVKSDWFGINLDTGNFNTEDPYGDLARIAPYAVVCQLKTEIHAKGKKKEDSDLAKLIGILRDVNYRGYVALEYEAAEDAKTAVPRALTALRKVIA
jgi:sugar phosphate isomerase/epimerase